MTKWIWDKGYIDRSIKNLNMSRVIIVSAFFSEYGLDLIYELHQKNNIQKENIIIYLSAEFCMIKPGELLERLTKIATVHIIQRPKLHAKVFMFYTEEGVRVYHGSANFTKGGLVDNLELTQEITLSDAKQLEEFVNHCQMASRKVGSEIILHYKNISDDLEQYVNSNQDASRKINEMFLDNGDPFREWDYDLDGYYFTFEDYETFFPKHQTKDDLIISNRRGMVRKKLLELNSSLKTEIASQLNLHNHWYSNTHPDLITSQITPSNFNHNRLSWICVRYGKHRNDALIGGAKTANHESFIKNACMQVSIVPEGVQIGLFHATANGAIDRDFLKKNIDDRKDDIIQQIANLIGEKLVWHIYDPKSGRNIHSFNIDKEDPNDFVDFYKKYDREGYETFCIFHMKPNDENLRSKESLVRIAKHKMSKLHSLYKLITWTIPKTNGM